MFCGNTRDRPQVRFYAVSIKTYCIINNPHFVVPPAVPEIIRIIVKTVLIVKIIFTSSGKLELSVVIGPHHSCSVSEDHVKGSPSKKACICNETKDMFN